MAEELTTLCNNLRYEIFGDFLIVGGLYFLLRLCSAVEKVMSSKMSVQNDLWISLYTKTRTQTALWQFSRLMKSIRLVAEKKISEACFAAKVKSLHVINSLSLYRSTDTRPTVLYAEDKADKNSNYRKSTLYFHPEKTQFWNRINAILL